MSSSCTYHELLAGCAITVNALVGTDPVELQTTYSSRPLTDEMFNSSIWPMNAIRDRILNAEQRLAQDIASVGNHPWRANLISQTRALFSGENMPATDVDGKSIIGIYGAVLDGDNPTIMPLYNYVMDGNGIIHTRNTVIVQVCVYDYATQQAAFDADETMLLPDALAPALIAGGVAGLVRDDEFMAQGQFYAQIFNSAEQAIRSGLTSVGGTVIPGAELSPVAA
jgi:hypothetical protein